MRILMVIALLCLPATAQADARLNTALRAFAADLSGNDPDVAAKIDQIIAKPPTTTETIGFYGVSDKSPEERIFRATIFTLSNAGYILGFEDKYINEMPWVLADRELIAASGDVDLMQDRILTAYDRGGDAGALKAALQAFPAHVTALGDAAHKVGRDFLYIDVPLGDTFHVALVTSDVATRWRDVLFLRTPDDHFAVTTPHWDTYWYFLSYAFGLNDAPSPVDPPTAALRSLKDLGF